MSAVKGLRERGDTEILEQNTPWKSERLACLNCGQCWEHIGLIGQDERNVKCPFCGTRNAEAADEAPLFLPVRH